MMVANLSPEWLAWISAFLFVLAEVALVNIILMLVGSFGPGWFDVGSMGVQKVKF